MKDLQLFLYGIDNNNETLGYFSNEESIPLPSGYPRLLGFNHGYGSRKLSIGQSIEGWIVLKVNKTYSKPVLRLGYDHKNMVVSNPQTNYWFAAYK